MQSPLSEAELAELESTLLPALERHHLRLLAHGLRTLQQIAGRMDGPPPSGETIRLWVLGQPATAGDEAFAAAFSAQMVGLGAQLVRIAAPSRQALDLDLTDLVTWARSQANARIADDTAPLA